MNGQLDLLIPRGDTHLVGRTLDVSGGDSRDGLKIVVAAFRDASTQQLSGETGRGLLLHRP
jgi:hypothetical protein